MDRGSWRDYSMNVLFRSDALKIIMDMSKFAHPALVDIYLPKKRQNSTKKIHKKFTQSSTKNSQNGFLEDKEKIIPLMELASPGF